MNDVQKLLDFQRVHDGSQELISADEQATAATDFKNLTEDASLAHAADIYQVGRFLKDQELQFIDRKTIIPLIVNGEDGSKLRISIMTSETKAEHKKPAAILLTEVDQESHNRRRVRYELARDESSVIRIDVTDDEKSDEELRQVIGPGIDGPQNRQLEEDLGLNRQPVGQKEISALRNLVMVAQADKPPYRQ